MAVEVAVVKRKVKPFISYKLLHYEECEFAATRSENVYALFP